MTDGNQQPLNDRHMNYEAGVKSVCEHPNVLLFRTVVQQH